MSQPTAPFDDIFFTASQLSPDERDAYLDEACRVDPELRSRVERFLAAQSQVGSFLEQPAVQPPSHRLAPTAVTPSQTDGPGTVLGPYKLLQEIGAGGMGTVYMAEQTTPVKRLVALKVIKQGMDTAQVVARFEAERQALALMDHPHIAKVLDAGTTEAGRPYFVMELVKGVPITKFCDEHQLTPRERMELFVPVCQAVQHAHQKGIIHRDLKPSNVLIASYDGRPVPKVIDFGVAKAMGQRLTERTMFTGFGGIVGTLEYMSPEQAEFNALDVDTRSDIYSLGVLLYELLTGSTPLTRQQLKHAAITEVLRLIREEEPPKPSTRLTESHESLASLSLRRKLDPAQLTQEVSGELDWIVMKALEKDRARRYETATGLARDVERYLRDEQVEACPPTLGYRLRKFARKHKRPVATVASFALVFVVAFATIAVQAFRISLAEQRAVKETRAALQSRDAATRALMDAETQRSKALWEKQRAQDAEAAATAERDRVIAERLRAEQAEQRVLAEAAITKTVTSALPGQLAAAAQSKKSAAGGLSELEPYLVTLVESLRKARGLDDADVLLAMKSLAACHRAQGKCKEAEPILRELVEGYRRTKGDRAPQTIETTIEWGATMNLVGQHAEAESLLNETKNVCEETFGEEHPLTGRVTQALASVYGLQGKDAQSARFSADAIAVTARLLIPHPQVTVAESSLRQMLPMLETKIPDDWRLFRLRMVTAG